MQPIFDEVKGNKKNRTSLTPYAILTNGVLVKASKLLLSPLTYFALFADLTILTEFP